MSPLSNSTHIITIRSQQGNVQLEGKETNLPAWGAKMLGLKTVQVGNKVYQVNKHNWSQMDQKIFEGFAEHVAQNVKDKSKPPFAVSVTEVQKAGNLSSHMQIQDSPLPAHEEFDHLSHQIDMETWWNDQMRKENSASKAIGLFGEPQIEYSVSGTIHNSKKKNLSDKLDQVHPEVAHEFGMAMGEILHEIVVAGNDGQNIVKLKVFSEFMKAAPPELKKMLADIYDHPADGWGIPIAPKNNIGYGVHNYLRQMAEANPLFEAFRKALDK